METCSQIGYAVTVAVTAGAAATVVVTGIGAVGTGIARLFHTCVETSKANSALKCRIRLYNEASAYCLIVALLVCSVAVAANQCFSKNLRVRSCAQCLCCVSYNPEETPLLP